MPRSLPLVLALLISANAFAATTVRDEAGLFSPAAVAKATETANSIKRDTGRDVTFETLAQLPADAPTAAQPFSEWAFQRAKNENASGVYILVVKSPGKVYIKPVKSALPLLPEADANRVRDVMLASFKEKQFDEGLQGGLDELRIRMLGNNGGSAAGTPQRSVPQSGNDSYGRQAPTPPAPTWKTALPGMGMLMCIIPLLVVAVGLFLVKKMFSRGQSGPGGPGNYGSPPPLPGQQGYYPNTPGPQGGGGFGRGAMGGVLGGLGGAWLYDKVFSGGSGGGGGLMGGGNSAHGSVQDNAPPQDYSGSTGDFGDSSSSSSFDSGGDSGGGGDFSGGDSGGGSSGDF